MLPDPRPSLSFIIPVRNDAAGLAKCLQSIRDAAGGVPIECIVLDNASIDGSGDVARRFGCRVEVATQGPVGRLRNRGAALARGELLAFVDADHTIHRAWVQAAVEVMADPGVVAAGAPCHAPSDGTWVQRSYDGLRDHRPGQRPVEWLGSGNMIVRAATFQRVAGFDDTLEACEDVDLCRKLRATGGVIISDSRLVNVHHGDPFSLRVLFKGEMWRGRNNLRVSLRERPTLRGTPSIVLPIVQLVALPLAAALFAMGQLAIAGLVVAGAIGPSALRAAQIRRRSTVNPAHAFAVAATYDLARAVALVFRTGHRRAAPQALVSPQ